MTDTNVFTFTFLSKEDIRIQKCIHLSKEFNHREYNADLVYWRKLASLSKPQYKLWNCTALSSNLYTDPDNLSDKFDDFILKTIQRKYPDATLTSALILTEEERDRRRKIIENYSKDFLEIRFLPKVDVDYCVKNNRFTFDGFFQRIHLYTTEYDIPMFANEGLSLYYDISDESMIRDFMDNLYDEIINTL